MLPAVEKQSWVVFTVTVEERNKGSNIVNSRAEQGIATS